MSELNDHTVSNKIQSALTFIDSYLESPLEDSNLTEMAVLARQELLNLTSISRTCEDCNCMEE